MTKTAYAIKTANGEYVFIRKDRFGLDVNLEESPEKALIWEGRPAAQELLSRAEQQTGQRCVLVEFELVEKQA